MPCEKASRPLTETYAGEQYVGSDLHRRRSVIVRTTEAGEVLEAVRIVYDVQRLASVMARAGDCPEVVLEATYGWHWAVDALQVGGANVHLAHPLGVKAFEHRRVRNNVRDAQDLADLLLVGRLPRRELLLRRPESCVSWSGAKPTGELASTLQGQSPRRAGQARGPGADERPGRVYGTELLDELELPALYAARIASPRRPMDDVDFDHRFRRHHPRIAGPRARVHRCQKIPASAPP
jgi:hypothetical protein